MKIRHGKINLAVRSQFRLNLMKKERSMPSILIELEKDLLNNHLKNLSPEEMSYFIENKENLLHQREIEFDLETIDIMANVEQEMMKMN